MTLTSNLSYWLRGTGRRRAADTIPVIEADRDYWKARAAVLTERLGCADDLLIRVCCANEQLRLRVERAEHDLSALNDAHEYVLQELDELAHRNTALRAENANLTAMRAPAPADSDTTVELGTGPLWGPTGIPQYGSAA